MALIWSTVHAASWRWGVRKGPGRGVERSTMHEVGAEGGGESSKRRGGQSSREVASSRPSQPAAFAHSGALPLLAVIKGGTPPCWLGGTPKTPPMMLVRSSDGLWPRPFSNGADDLRWGRSSVGKGPLGLAPSLPSIPLLVIFRGGWGGHRGSIARPPGVRRAGAHRHGRLL
ncbi:MAG: hypothetical protein CM15mP128_1790 [Methanobacteriota archaeon]|nr:MAG: hypothetical protein CM15mP128_1790 [Euryarchaeota archaeon]